MPATLPAPPYPRAVDVPQPVTPSHIVKFRTNGAPDQESTFMSESAATEYAAGMVERAEVPAANIVIYANSGITFGVQIFGAHPSPEARQSSTR